VYIFQQNFPAPDLFSSGLDEATRRMQGLLVGVGVWLLAAFGRAINYSNRAGIKTGDR